jgi:hypothetical protein
VIDSLGSIGNDDEVADALVALLAKDSWAAKGTGLVLRGELPPWGRDGRGYVIVALGKMGARKAAPKLLEVLQEKGPDKAHFEFAIVPLLAEWGHKPSIPVFKRLLVRDGTERRNIAEALLRLKDRSGMAVLVRALASGNRNDRCFACKAFAQYGDRSDVLLLGPCLDDEDGEVQMWTCRGLERITGVINRAPGQTMQTSADVPLWKAWFEKNKEKYQHGK